MQEVVGHIAHLVHLVHLLSETHTPEELVVAEVGFVCGEQGDTDKLRPVLPYSHRTRFLQPPCGGFE